MTSAPALTDYFIRSAFLSFDIADKSMIVRSLMNVTRLGQHENSLVLEGNYLQTLEARMDGKPVGIDTGLAAGTKLTFPAGHLSSCFIFTSVLHPLSSADDGICLMPDDMRELTWIIPRQEQPPAFVVKITTDPALSVVRAQGRILDQGIKDGRHYSYWVSDHARPTSEFALVAGTEAYIQTLRNRHFEPESKKRLLSLIGPESPVLRIA